MNTKGKNYKKYLEVQRRQGEVLDAQRKLGYIPLDKPYQKGWDSHWELRVDISRRDDADILQHILDRFSVDVWCGNRDFVIWNRNERRYDELNPYIKTIDGRTWESLPVGAKKWFKISPDKNEYYHWYGIRRKYVCVIPAWFFEKKITKSMVTHRREHDEILEQEYAELDFLERKYSDYIPWYRRSYGKAKSYRTIRNRSFRAKEKRVVNKALRTEDWDNMDLPEPKKQVLWDIW